MSFDVFLELADCRSTLSVGTSVDTQPISLRLTVGDVSIDCWWYRSIVNSFCAEVGAVSYPQVTRKKSPSPMLVC